MLRPEVDVWIACWLVATAAGADWGETIEQVVGSVLVVRYERPRPFDGSSASAAQATGFVVDAERGIVLTNRHVVGTGPQVARGLFANQEEIALQPLYSDPIHDFGFYRYDPAALRFNAPRSLPLHPAGAVVGTDIRLIGNDAGEQLSILDATLSRVDRPAPWWDMNTFYVQAASDSSGGSSGSPVFDIDGRVVALNAGGRTRESTSFYLRLERVQAALAALQREELPPRGGLRVELDYRTWDELRRLGLSPATEAAARAAWDGAGMLVVDTVGRGGPADGALQPGDVLLAVDGVEVFSFEALEAHLDAAVGRQVQVRLERAGVAIEHRLDVVDLHALAPDRFVELADAVFHGPDPRDTLRNNRLHAGVVVAEPGRMLRAASVPTGAFVEAIGGRPVGDLEDLIAAFEALPLGATASIVTTRLADPNAPQSGQLRRIDGVMPDRSCRREAAGWACEPIVLEPPPGASPRPTAVPQVPVAHRRARHLARRLVLVASESRFPLHSTSSTGWKSVGLVIDAEAGLVLTDRYAVPNEASEVTVQAVDSPRIPAEIVAIDPLYNTALVRYDAALLDLGRLRPLRWRGDEPVMGRKYWAAVLDSDGRPFSAPRELTSFDELSLSKTPYPKFRADNLMTYSYGRLERSTFGGVVLDRRGRIVSLYQRFRNERESNRPQAVLHAIGTEAARDVIAGTSPWYAGVELRRMSLARAREAGLDEGEAERVRSHRPHDPVVMEVWRVDPTIATDVQVGDVLLEAAGRPVTTFRELQDALTDEVAVRVLRDGQRLDARIAPRSLALRGASRVVRWAGAWIQEEPLEVAREAGTPPAGVYISWYYGGSPAQRYGLGYGRRLVSIDDRPVASLDDLLAAVASLDDGDSVRVGLQTLTGKPELVTLRVDQRWWPTVELRRGADGWERIEPGG